MPEYKTAAELQQQFQWSSVAGCMDVASAWEVVQVVTVLHGVAHGEGKL